MISTEQEMLQFLDKHQIAYHYTAHPPVYTCEQAELYRPRMGGVSTKNLFLQDERHQFYLAVTACEKRLDMKALGKSIQTSKLHFGAEEKLLEMLGVTPGAVTVLGLINDTHQRLRLLIDEEIWDSGAFLGHPLVNTATLEMSKASLLAFFALSGHQPEVIPFPGRDLTPTKTSESE